MSDTFLSFRPDTITSENEERLYLPVVGSKEPEYFPSKSPNHISPYKSLTTLSNS